ncbi:hypothetical protein [Bradyrhizobium jicamae]|uniref:hypothetical protein n=1 Tax=Bradyrhizobium jicamae TaxID=280332 RepID=UPI001BAC8815|nr:hypothetical protein [Bradyrhizobium jicamae]MBR0937253.1 hypothetical protein [Bradyrhizobium jicamae]
MLKLIRPQRDSALLQTALRTLVVGALACLLAIYAGMPARAQSLLPRPNWNVSPPKCADSQKICIMTIKIFNNDPDHWIYPVLTTGKGPADIWMQAWWSVPNSELPNYPFIRRKNYRLYINPTGAGIPPNTGIELTVPIFTQLYEPINANPPADASSPSGGDTLINWWNGGVIQVYTSPQASPPLALQQALTRSTQKVVQSGVSSAVLPKCVAVASVPTKTVRSPPAPPPCQPLTIYSDDSDLAKNDPSQLIEYTFGARNDPKDINAGPRYLLDTSNVDFDVSYVNVAFAPAVMGPYKNNQVGYIGTPITIDNFNLAIDEFLHDFPGWPQFLREGQLVNKLASPLEVFARLGGKDPPPDLTQLRGWPGSWPADLWAPIQALRTKWREYAGTVTAIPGPQYVQATPGICGPLPLPDAPAPTNFCDAVVAVQQLLIKNYVSYRQLYAAGQCKGTAFDITDNLLISHVYGWAPWTESSSGKDGDGCAAAQNLLENTARYSTGIDYTNYLNVKVAFDKLNYGTFPPRARDQIYQFNPWVQFIHGVPNGNPHKYVSTDYAYAYSVDDAMGNIQAEGVGIIIDIGSTANLENQKPATQPILVTLGGAEPVKGIAYKAYAICENTAANTKNLNPNFTTFAVSGNDPANCPIYIYDSKVPSQLYAFKIDATPDQFPYFANPADARWLPGNAKNSTTKIVVCSGIPDAGAAQGYQQSSATACCDSASNSGVFAFAQPEPHDAHNTKKYIVNVPPPKRCTNDTDAACFYPTPPPITKACNRGLP